MRETPRDRLDPPARQHVRASEPWLEILEAPARDGVTVTEVCRRYRISRKSYYSYLARYREHGVAGLAPRSRRPKNLPARTPADIEALVVRVRLDQPRWGARRIRTHLLRTGSGRVPALSTVHAILRRHGLVGAHDAVPATPQLLPANEHPTTHRTSSPAGDHHR